MNALKVVTTLTLILISVSIFSQKRLSNFVEISASLGSSNNLESEAIYRTWNLPEKTVIDSKSFARGKSYSVGLGGLIYKESGIKLSIGQMEYGFDFEGSLENSGTRNNGYFKVIYLELYAGLIQKIRLANSYKLIFDGGIFFHTDASPRSNTLSLRPRNSRSFGGFAGMEIPMRGNNFFINAGLQFKTPLKTYNASSSSQSEYHPYFIGLKIGMNYQF